METVGGPTRVRRRRVLIIGKGNRPSKPRQPRRDGRRDPRGGSELHPYGLEVSLCRSSLRALNNNLLDTYQTQVPKCVLDGNIERIDRRGDRYIVTIRFGARPMSQKDLTYVG